MTIVCKVDDLVVGYKIGAQDDGSKKCSIVLRSPDKKLNVENVFVGEGLIDLSYTTKNIDPALVYSLSGSQTVKRVWRFDPYLSKSNPAPYTTGESDGETLEVTLGETAASKL